MAERPWATTVPIRLAIQINTSKLIEKRIELSSSSVFATADAERGPPDPALGEASFAMGCVGVLGVITMYLSKKKGRLSTPPDLRSIDAGA